MKASFKIRCDSTCLNESKMIQDLYNGGQGVTNAVSGQEKGREKKMGRNRRKDQLHRPIFKAASSTSSIKYLSTYPMPGKGGKRGTC